MNERINVDQINPIFDVIHKTRNNPTRNRLLPGSCFLGLKFKFIVS